MSLVQLTHKSRPTSKWEQVSRCSCSPTGPVPRPSSHTSSPRHTICLNWIPHPSPQIELLTDREALANAHLRIETLVQHGDMLARQAGSAKVSYNTSLKLLKQEVATLTAEKHVTAQQHEAALAAASSVESAAVSQLKGQVEGLEREIALLQQCEGGFSEVCMLAQSQASTRCRSTRR